MVEKRGVGEHARPAALQDLRDMAKAGLLEPQTSEMGLTSLVTACQDGADRIGRLISRRLKPPSVGRRPARPFKGTNEGPKPTSFHTNSVDLIEGCSRDNKIPQTL